MTRLDVSKGGTARSLVLGEMARNGGAERRGGN